MAILLAGGAGFIGSHTAVELMDAGYEVVIVDNFYNSSPEVVRRIEEISGKSVKVYNVDAADNDAMDKVFEENEIETVIHFAGLKSVGESVSLPLKYYRNNLDSTLTILELMEKHDVRNIIFSSSATVYGSPKKVPITEDMPTGGCTNPYGKTKFMIEDILQDAAVANKNLSVVLLRYFNPIGAHESGRIGEMPSGVPNNLMPYITQVAIGKLKELSVYGNDYPTHDGTGVRDYIHVVDLAKGHIKALEKLEKENSGIYIYNLGTGVGYSVLDMVKAFEESTGKKVNYKIVERRAGDIATCYSDPQKAKNELHWEATKTLNDMCKDSWKYIQNRKK